MGRKKYILLLLLLWPFNISLSQGNLQLYGVNGWNLWLVSPPPYDVFDTAWTGMSILQGEIIPSDSIQLFQMYEDSRHFPPK